MLILYQLSHIIKNKVIEINHSYVDIFDTYLISFLDISNNITFKSPDPERGGCCRVNKTPYDPEVSRICRS